MYIRFIENSFNDNSKITGDIGYLENQSYHSAVVIKAGPILLWSHFENCDSQLPQEKGLGCNYDDNDYYGCQRIQKSV